MVVEDHTEARAAMRLLLEAEGYDAVGAVDGQEALDHLRRGRASLILLDLMLPHNNGSEFSMSHHTVKLRRGRYTSPETETEGDAT